MRHGIVALAMALFLSAAATRGMAEDKTVVVIETSMGNIEVELYPDKAPETVKNFLAYVNDKFFDGTVFHRVMSNFMIQGGGFTKDLKEKQTKAAIKNEAANGLSNTVGTIAMARTPEPNSATAQFFINVADNSGSLDKATCPDGFGYCVFGKVTAGMDVVNKIKAVQTGESPLTQQSGEKTPPQPNVPKESVTIKSVTVKK